MNDNAKPENQFSIQKLYIKDISFESPATPEVFNFSKWEPKIELNLNNSNKQVSNGVYEVVLSVTATASQDDKTAFLVEIHQAGVFNVIGFNENDTRYILNAQCMTILFPYARELISEMTSRGGFPPLLLNPVNFDALFASAIQQESQAKSEETVKH
jgi:preprotein translocase subunit SecB